MRSGGYRLEERPATHRALWVCLSACPRVGGTWDIQAAVSVQSRDWSSRQQAALKLEAWASSVFMWYQLRGRGTPKQERRQ